MGHRTPSRIYTARTVIRSFRSGQPDAIDRGQDFVQSQWTSVHFRPRPRSIRLDFASRRSPPFGFWDIRAHRDRYGTAGGCQPPWRDVAGRTSFAKFVAPRPRPGGTMMVLELPTRGWSPRTKVTTPRLND